MGEAPAAGPDDRASRRPGRLTSIAIGSERRLSRFAVNGDGLGARETVAEFGEGIFPDGFAFDAEGGIWIASVVSNRLLRIAPDGSRSVVLDDGDPEVIARAERNFA